MARRRRPLWSEQEVETRVKSRLSRSNEVVTVSGEMGSPPNVLLLGLAALFVTAFQLYYGHGGFFVAIALLGLFVWLNERASRRVRRFTMSLLRWLARTLIPRLWDVRARGLEHLPATGGAILVCNRTTSFDALLLMAILPRHLHFIVSATEMKRPVLGPLLRLFGAIPLETGQGRRRLQRSIRRAATFAARGRLVCLFAEGDLTRTGMLLPFRRGFERLIRERPVPLIPACLESRWASPMAVDAAFVSGRWPPFRFPVHARIGVPLAPGTPLVRIRSTIQELGCDLWREAAEEFPPLTALLVRRMRSGFWKQIAADPQCEGITRWGLMSGAVAWAHAWHPLWAGQANVAILLPPGIPAAMANICLALSGRGSVNLNYTAGAANMVSALRQAGVRTMLTSRRFAAKIGFNIPQDITVVEVDEERARLDLFFRLVAAFFALSAPLSWLEAWCGAERRTGAGDVVTTIFTSGSTGEPKGVPLTHRNIVSDSYGTSLYLKTSDADSLIGILPLFHSFGYMFLWYALIQGIQVVFHPTPLEAGPIGDAIERYRITLLISTPTFLQLYLKKVSPEKFRSLRLVLTGAEKLPDRLARAFGERFGIRPIEGYGTSECAPVVSTSVLEPPSGRVRQTGYRRGFIGHPLPGIAVRIVDPDTWAPLPNRQPGLMLVKGPNVMSGYLNRPSETAAVLKDGWYATGDIAFVDDDGFLRITDRLSRFSKIGGEMIPHGRVEEALQEAAGAEARVFAVTSVADARRGESLAVLHTLPEAELLPVLAKLQMMGLPNLYIPKREQYYRVDALPMLGTGKLDLKGMKQVAAARARAAELEAAMRKEVRICPEG
ncbi:MAG TPA: AMP-binding protein [Candidatus Ozemobacteraceae bacterium]